MTNDEKEFHSLQAQFGCIACYLDGRKNTWVSIHHTEGRTKKDCEKKTLALCSEHHQTGGEEAPSIHPWRRRFESKYGTEQELLLLTKTLIRWTKW